MTIPSLQRKLEAADVPPERLAGHSQLTQEQKVAEAARQFEAVLLRQILESTQKTVSPSSLSNDSTASTIYRDMVTNQLADSISRSGALGLAKTLEADFMKQLEASKPDKAEHATGAQAEPQETVQSPARRYLSPHDTRPDWRAVAKTHHP
jgi:flagellar protein FlgJ